MKCLPRSIIINPLALAVRIKRVLPFPAKIETTLDSVYRIYKIICPGRKPGQILHPQKSPLEQKLASRHRRWLFARLPSATMQRI